MLEVFSDCDGDQGRSDNGKCSIRNVVVLLWMLLVHIFSLNNASLHLLAHGMTVLSDGLFGPLALLLGGVESLLRLM